MRYKARFDGRKLGALGMFYDIETEVEAADKEAARLKLYETFEHIQGLELEEINPARERLIEQLAEAFEQEQQRIDNQGVGTLPDDLEQYAADLLDWCNVCEEDHNDESLKVLFLFGSSLRFRAFDCGHCGARCYQGYPDASEGAVSWDDFQGADQTECHAVCDSCHMRSADARELERDYEEEHGLR